MSCRRLVVQQRWPQAAALRTSPRILLRHTRRLHIRRSPAGPLRVPTAHRPAGARQAPQGKCQGLARPSRIILELSGPGPRPGAASLAPRAQVRSNGGHLVFTPKWFIQNFSQPRHFFSFFLCVQKRCSVALALGRCSLMFSKRWFCAREGTHHPSGSSATTIRMLSSATTARTRILPGKMTGQSTRSVDCLRA